MVLLGLGVGLKVGVGAGVGGDVREGAGLEPPPATAFGCCEVPPWRPAGLGAPSCKGVASPAELRTGQLSTCWGPVAANDGALPGATCVSARRTAPPITATAAAAAKITRLMRDQRCPDAS